MGGFLDNLKRGLQNFMQGRYGIDKFSTMLVIVGFALTLIGMFTGFELLSYVSLVVLVYAMFRSYSKNTVQRTKELATYTRIIQKPKAWASLTKKKWDNRSTTHYFKCEQCKTVLSVPRGKGKIKVTCPKCKKQTVRKS